MITINNKTKLAGLRENTCHAPDWSSSEPHGFLSIVVCSHGIQAPLNAALNSQTPLRCDPQISNVKGLSGTSPGPGFVLNLKPRCQE